MRAFLFGLFVYAIFFVFGRWFFVCETLGKCDNTEQQTSIPDREKSLYLYDADTLIAGPFNHFYFKKDSITPVLDASNETFLNELQDWLNQNPDRKVMITGVNTDTEKASWKSKIYEFPGIARAAFVENLLERKGIDQKRIETGYETVDSVTVRQPLLFKIMPRVSKTGYDIPQYRFEDNTFSDANFAFNSAQFTPGVQLAEYADSVKTFLDINPDYMLTIIGHTDSIGTEEYNMTLGLARANSAKEYFEELGITRSINTVSMGKTQYVAPNSNPDGSDNELGRQKNRRVNFKLLSKEQ